MMKIVHFIIVSFLIIGFSGCSVWQPQKQTDVLINKKVINLPQTANYLKMSPNGKYVLFTCTDCGRILFPSKKKPTDIYVWDIEKDEKVIQIDREDYNISHMREGFIFTPDSENILFFNRNGMNIYNIVQNKIIETIDIDAKTKKMEEDFNKKYPNALTQPTQNMMGTFSPDGKYYITKSFYNKDTKKAPLLGGFILFDAKTFEPVHYIYDIYPSENKELVFSEDGRYFVDTYLKPEFTDNIDIFCNEHKEEEYKLICETKDHKYYTTKRRMTDESRHFRVWSYDDLVLKFDFEVPKKFQDKINWSFQLVKNNKYIINPGSFEWDFRVGKNLKNHYDAVETQYYNIETGENERIFQEDYFVGCWELRILNNDKYAICLRQKYKKQDKKQDRIRTMEIINLTTNNTIQNIEMPDTNFNPNRTEIDLQAKKVAILTNKKSLLFNDDIIIYDIHIPNIVKNEE